MKPVRLKPHGSCLTLVPIFCLFRHGALVGFSGDSIDYYPE